MESHAKQVIKMSIKLFFRFLPVATSEGVVATACENLTKGLSDICSR